MKLEAVRAAALALPETSEEPHHDFGSFRVRGKIFVTVPPDQEHIHVFVNEQDREVALAAYPEFTEKLFWGGKVVGIRIVLARADAAAVTALIRQAHACKSERPPARRATRRASGRSGRRDAA